MRLLLDTHTFLWWVGGDKHLSDKVIEHIGDVKNEIFFSVASSWEIGIKYELKKLSLPMTPEVFIPEHLELCQFSVLPINLCHTLIIRELPWHHKDPFDRMLVAQAKAENMALITADETLKQYDIDTVW